MSDSTDPIIFSTKDDKDAQFTMAGQFHADGDFEQAVHWLEKAAKNGHVQAKTNLGLMYFFGEGVEQDYDTAFKWFKSSATNDDLTARYYLSLCFLDGLGVEQDEDYAMRVLWKCASDGMDWAQFTLAECYEQGRVVKQDLFEAVSWYARAAQGDVPEANDRFRQLYYENEFTDSNGEKRFFWFEEENMSGEN
jgi:TPR repeat protein